VTKGDKECKLDRFVVNAFPVKSDKEFILTLFLFPSKKKTQFECTNMHYFI